MKKIIIRIIMLLAVTVGVFLISGSVRVSAAAKLNKTSVTIEVGERKKVKVKNTTKTVKWRSSDKSIATVTKRGNIDAKAKGECTITATVGKKKLTCKVTVTDAIGDLLDKEVDHEDIRFRISSGWEYIEDASGAEGFYSYDMDKNTFKILSLELSEESEKDYNIRTESEENFLKTVKAFVKAYKNKYAIMDAEYSIIKTDTGFLGHITGYSQSGNKNIYMSIYIKLTSQKIIIVTGMDYDKLTSSTDKIAERVCKEAKLLDLDEVTDEE